MGLTLLVRATKPLEPRNGSHVGGLFPEIWDCLPNRSTPPAAYPPLCSRRRQNPRTDLAATLAGGFPRGSPADRGAPTAAPKSGRAALAAECESLLLLACARESQPRRIQTGQTGVWTP